MSFDFPACCSSIVRSTRPGEKLIVAIQMMLHLRLDMPDRLIHVGACAPAITDLPEAVDVRKGSDRTEVGCWY